MLYLGAPFVAEDYRQGAAIRVRIVNAIGNLLFSGIGEQFQPGVGGFALSLLFFEAVGAGELKGVGETG